MMQRLTSKYAFSTLKLPTYKGYHIRLTFTYMYLIKNRNYNLPPQVVPVGQIWVQAHRLCLLVCCHAFRTIFIRMFLSHEYAML